MTEELIVSTENLEQFKEACRLEKVDFEIVGEGIDGDTYSVTFDTPSQLYYLGRMMQLMVTTEHFKSKLHDL